MGQLPITAVVITRNEERNIVRCLESLVFCDEIIVVDSESTDQTRALAGALASSVIIRPWSGYSDQKNFGNTLSKNDWILSVDADEEVSAGLRQEIHTLFGQDLSASAFSIPRRTIHFGRWIKYGGWYPNRLLRLFRKSQGRWVGDEVHEKWETTGPVLILKENIDHHSFVDLFDQVARNNRYSSLGAEQLAKHGKPFSVIYLLLKTTSKFFETYLLKKGFLDGYPGFIISVSAAYSVFLKWAKLWEIENVEKKS